MTVEDSRAVEAAEAAYPSAPFYVSGTNPWPQSFRNAFMEGWRAALDAAPVSDPQCGNAPAALDPQPWVFVSDQVFGVRSAIDKGFHAVSGAYYAFQPRGEYEQDRSRYESNEVSDPRHRVGA